MSQTELFSGLEEHARRMRQHIIRMTSAAGSGHPGPSFSPVEILAALYFSEMSIDASRPLWPERDRFVLSKGHAAPVLYAALYEAGYFPEDVLLSLRKIGSLLQGHPNVKTPGVDATTGSLGIGLSQAVGMALGARMQKSPVRVYSVIGDGECDEGQIWEAAMAAARAGPIPGCSSSSSAGIQASWARGSSPRSCWAASLVEFMPAVGPSRMVSSSASDSARTPSCSSRSWHAVADRLPTGRRRSRGVPGAGAPRPG